MQGMAEVLESQYPLSSIHSEFSKVTSSTVLGLDFVPTVDRVLLLLEPLPSYLVRRWG
jgi:hypothetical protein